MCWKLFGETLMVLEGKHSSICNILFRTHQGEFEWKVLCCHLLGACVQKSPKCWQLDEKRFLHLLLQLQNRGTLRHRMNENLHASLTVFSWPDESMFLMCFPHRVALELPCVGYCKLLFPSHHFLNVNLNKCYNPTCLHVNLIPADR